MQNNKETLSIYDVAAAAGVSIATVSRVIGGSDKVSDKTREKVMAVIRDTHYVPNAFARGLGLGTMKMVGILCTDVSDIFYALAVSILERLLAGQGLNSLLYCTGHEREDKERGLEVLLGNRVDAIMLVGTPFVEENNSHILRASGQVPVFCVNGYIEGKNVYSALCDEEQAMYENARDLLAAGCKHILYLYDSLFFSGRNKLAGLRRAHMEQGVELCERLVVRVDRRLEAIEECVEALIAQGLDFDGVLAAEDILAVGACKVLARHAIKLPVIGFNNSILAECATPALTSMDNMIESVCTGAVSMLASLLEGRPAPRKITVSGQLVERETFRAGR